MIYSQETRGARVRTSRWDSLYLASVQRVDSELGRTEDGCDREACGGERAAAALVHLWETTFLLLGSQEEADHPQQLQVGRGHLDPAQRLVEKVDGQVEGVCLETHHVLVGERHIHL